MALTPILGIQQVATNQSNKEATINDAILALEGAANGTLELDYSSLSGSYTLSELQFARNFLFKATNTPDLVLGVTLLVPRTLNAHAVQRIFVVKNDSTAVLTVKVDSAAVGTSGADGLVLPEGSSRLIAMDGDELFIASEATTVSRFIDLGDVPGTYEGSAGKTFRINAAEDGLELVDGLSIAELSDTSADTPADGSILRYNASSQLWVSTPLSLINTFLGLSDTPNSFEGMAGYLMQVNAGENSITFVNPAALGGPVTAGGNTGQILTKNSAVDGDYDWADPDVVLPAGGQTGQFLKKNSNEEGDAIWSNLPTSEDELPVGGTAGQILAKASNADGDVTWVPVSVLQESQYAPAIVNAVAVSELSSNRFVLPFTPTAGNALIVGYFSNVAINVASGWTALSALAANSWWSGAKVFGRIVQTGDSTTIVPCNVGSADAVVVFEVDMRYLAGGLTGFGIAMGYSDTTLPQITCDGATIIAAGVVNRAGAPTVLTVADADANAVPLLDANNGGNRFAGGVFVDPAPNGLDPTIAFDMGGGTSGAYFYLAFDAIPVAIEEAPTDGKTYVRRNKVWQVQGPALPTGGAAAQILAKVSATDGDATWVDAPAGVPVGGTSGQIIVKGSATPGDYAWTTKGFVPTGGATGQMLVKNSANNFDVTWAAKPLSLPAGGTDGQVLVKSGTTDGSAAWADKTHDIPTGGAAGQYLVKNSATNFDAVWAAGPSGVPTGGTTGQVLAKVSDTSGDVTWKTPATGIPTGGSIGQMLVKSGTADGAISWTAAPTGVPNGGTAGQVLAKFTSANGALAWVDPGIGDAPKDNTLYARINGGWQAFSPDDGTGGSTGGAEIVRPHRYWRLSITGNNGSATLALSELVLRTETGGPDRATGGSGFGSLNSPADAFDQIDTTEVSDANTTGTIGYDFGVNTVKGIMEVQVWGPSNPAMAPSGFVVQYSDDNAAWTTAWSVTGQSGWTAREKRTFTNPAPDYVAGNYTLEAPTDSKTYVRKNGTWVEEGDTLPAGGAQNQILTKNSATDGDAVWANPPKGIPNGGEVGQVLAKATAVDGDVAWQTPIKDFTGLSDTPSAYTGAGGKLVAVNAGATAVEFIDVPSATPEYPTMTGNSGKVLTVNAGGTDVEWKTPPTGIPTGGTTGQALTKTSNTDGAVAWATVSGLPTGGSAGQVLTKNSGTNGDASWVSPNIAVDGPGAFTHWRALITAGNGSCSIAALEFRATAGGTDQAAGSGGSASQSSYYSSTYDGSKAFDSNAATWWQASAATYPQWVSYFFPSAVEVREIAITSRNDSGYAQGPTAGVVQYSADGTTWYQAFTFSTTDDWSSAEQRLFEADYSANVEEAPEDGKTYARKDGAWVEVSATGGVGTLADLTDVDLTTSPPSDGQALVYDSGTGTWIPGSVAGGSATFTPQALFYSASLSESLVLDTAPTEYMEVLGVDVPARDTDRVVIVNANATLVGSGMRWALFLDGAQVWPTVSQGADTVDTGDGTNWFSITSLPITIPANAAPRLTLEFVAQSTTAGRTVPSATVVINETAVYGTVESISAATPSIVPLTVINPGAETGDLTGWQVPAGASAMVTSDVQGGYGPASGSLFFWGGSNANSGMYQDIDVSQYSDLIDAGSVEYIATVKVMNDFTTSEQATFSAMALDSAGNMLAYANQSLSNVLLFIPGVWFPMQHRLQLPAGTAKVRLQANAVRLSGTNNDTCFDDFTAALRIIEIDKYPIRRLESWTVNAVGTGASQTIALPVTVSRPENILVYVNGIRFHTSDYSLGYQAVTLTTNGVGDAIEIVGASAVQQLEGDEPAPDPITTTADFALVPSGTNATAQDTAAGVVLSMVGAGSGDHLAGLEKAVSGSWEFSCKLDTTMVPRAYMGFGLYVGNTSSGRITSFCWGGGSGIGTRVLNWNSWTSYNGAVYETDHFIGAMPIWMKLAYDGTSLYWYTSRDGQFWTLYYKYTGPVFTGTPDKAGVIAVVNQASGPSGSLVTEHFHIASAKLVTV